MSYFNHSYAIFHNHSIDNNPILYAHIIHTYYIVEKLFWLPEHEICLFNICLQQLQNLVLKALESLKKSILHDGLQQTLYREKNGNNSENWIIYIINDSTNINT